MDISHFSIRAWPGLTLSALAVVLALAGCASAPGGYGLASPQLNDEALLRQQVANKEPEANSRGMYISLIREMQDTGLYFASLAHIDAFEQKYGAVPEVELMRGHALREAGQVKESETVYRKLLQTPVGAAAWQGLGLLAGARSDYGSAVTALREAAQRDPTNALIVSDLGYALLRNGDTTAARLPIVQAAELAPGSSKILGNLAVFLQVSGDTKRADVVMKKAGLSEQAQLAVRKLAADITREQRMPTQAVSAPRTQASARQVVRAIPTPAATPEMSGVADAKGASQYVDPASTSSLIRNTSASAAPPRPPGNTMPLRENTMHGDDMARVPLQSLLDRFGTNTP